MFSIKYSKKKEKSYIIKMKSVVLLVLLATAFATNLAAFEKLEKSKLGKTLLNTIAIQM